MTVLTGITTPTPGRGLVGRTRSVLAVTGQMPWPLNTGGHLRTFHMLRAISRQHRLRLVVPMRPGEEEALSQLRQQGLTIRAVPVSQRTALSEARRMGGAALRRQPYVMYRRHYHHAVARALREEWARESPEVLYLDHPDSYCYAVALPDRPVVADFHNVYSVLLSRTAEERSGLKRWYLHREARLLCRVERSLAERVGALFCVSNADAEYFRIAGGTAVHVVPNGVDCQTYAGLPTGRRQANPLVLFIGAMSWEPNVSAAGFLARRVLPELRQQWPQARLRVVGRDPVTAVRELACLPGVEVTGTVPDVVPHLAEASALAVPLEAGGGTRLKILEAFAAGLPVVSTPVGCEGLNVRPEEHLLVADRTDFAAVLNRVLFDGSFAHVMAERSRLLAREHYDWQPITRRACDLLAQV